MTEHRQLLQQALTTIERLEARLAAAERAHREPIAIIGAGCRYPGGIEDPEGLWRLVRDGVDAVSDVPADRWDADAVYDPDPAAPGKAVSKRGGFLSQVDRFDPQFFGISPREAETMDPQQRLLLETAHEALESAAVATDRLAGTATGVFVGITTSDYGQLLGRGGPEDSDVYRATGNALNAAAGRIAFTFGLQGPCVAVDTACSSSLVAVHLACQSLRTRESDLALAGGVNVILSPDAMVLFSKWGMLAPDGRCKTFDARADGFVRSEGCAVLALRRLSDALAVGDPVLAVIRGSAVNSDGRSSGLTVPNGPAQQAVLRKALANAGLDAADIDYVEAHGTGTPLGDPIEFEALGAVLGKGRTADRPLFVGSVKTNLGHTESASGVAGLLKTVMALRHEAIPPHLHFAQPNPRIPWAELSVAVPTTLIPWPRGARPRRAGVSSFGFSGTNAHVILEEAPLPTASVPTGDGPKLVPVSAHDDAALRAQARRFAQALTDNPDLPLADVATTAGTGRAHHTRRLALVAESGAELVNGLATFAAGFPLPQAAEGAIRPGERPKIAFLFTGQGSQYPGMGRGLYEGEPVFRATLDRAARVLAPLLDRPLLEILFGGAGAALNNTAYTQPALFALQIALAELFRSWGITPSVVLGHSLGEYAAACVAGVFDTEDALALVAERARLMAALPAGGGMAAVFAGEVEIAARIGRMADRLVVAAINGPEETVISGDADALAGLLTDLAANGIAARRLDVSHAFHSPRLDPILDALEQRAAAITYRVPRLPLISNLTGAPFAPKVAPDANYWRCHTRDPVQFAACVEALRATGATALVEVGPHPTLLGLTRRVLPGATWTSIAPLSRGGDDRREALSALAKLYCLGAPVAWDVLAAPASRRRALPTYPFQRQRYWTDTARLATARPGVGGHPLLGERRALASAPGTSVWEREIGLKTHPWLRDHRVQGEAIVPATAYIEMALAAGREVLGAGSLSVRRIENLKPLILHGDVGRTVQVTLVTDADGGHFSVHSRGVGPSMWTAHVTAYIGRVTAPSTDGRRALAEGRARCVRVQDGHSFYASMVAKGNDWGPCFQGVQQLWLGDDEAVGRVAVASAITDRAGGYCFHPAVSDACGHVLVATVPDDRGVGAFVGAGVGEIRFHRSPVGTSLWVHAKLRPDARGRVVGGDVLTYDESGELVSEALDARLWYLDETDDWAYQVNWREQELGAAGPRRAGDGPWVVFADRGRLAEAIAAQRPGARTVLVRAGTAWSLDADRASVRPSEPGDVRRLLAAVGRPGAVVFLGGVDDAETAPETLLHLIRGLVASDVAGARLWLATRGAQAAVGGDACPSPWGACLWGLGRTLSVEHAEFWGGVIDLDGVDDSSLLVREIGRGTAEDKVAFRGGRRYVSRLCRRPPRAAERDFIVRGDGTHLITGGLGGIGLAVARWLVDRGARHLLLVGRTAAVGPKLAAVAELEALGARVETAAVDVAVEGTLEACLGARRVRGEPPLCGVIHAAGVLRFEALATLNVAALRADLAAKVVGAWHLHRILRDDPVDYFAMCSSSSALLPSPLLGGYAAGNAFLDALAHHRRARGLPGLSINWGTWGEVGMAVERGRGAADGNGGLLTGMGTIPTARGLAVLRDLLAAGDVQAAVLPVDWPKLAAAYPAFVADPFFAVLVDCAPGTRPTASPLVALRDAPQGDRAGLLCSYLQQQAARVLGTAADGVDPAIPLSSLGFDSLMAVQLKNQIQADLGVIVPMIQFLQAPSIDELLRLVLEAVVTLPYGSETARDLPSVVWEEGTI